MKKLLLLIIGVLIALPTFARDFSYTYEGITITYTVLNEWTKTCATKGLSLAIGDVIIPPKVKDGETEYTVTTIGSYTFKSEYSITSITIPNTVTTIADHAFYNCSSHISSLTIPDSVTTIGDYAFWGWWVGPTSVTIGNSVTSIGEYAFYGCPIESLTFGNSVTVIGDHAFDKCENLTTLILPESLTSIGSYAFFESNPTSLTIPKNVTTIGDRAFSSFNGHLYLNAENWIGEYPYYDMGYLFPFTPFGWIQHLTVGEKVKTIPVGAFSLTSKLKSVTFENSATIISDYAFYESNIETLDLGDSVIYIGDYAFSFHEGYYGPRGLHMDQLIIPESVTYIGESAFYRNHIQSLVIGGSNNTIRTIIGNSAFEMYDLTSVTIGNSVGSIGDKAFISGKLSSLTLGNSVSSIGKYAFAYSNINSLTIPNSLKYLGEYAFCNCPNLTSVAIPEDLEGITVLKGTFSGCSSLESVTIPNSVTEIGNQAFSGCASLTSVTIPNHVTIIGDQAFSGCASLTSIVIPNSVTEIGGSAFSGCASLTSMAIPNPVTEICDSAFYGCASMTSVTIPKSVTRIDSNAFGQCRSLTSVTIPDSVKYIGYQVFSGCVGLKEVYYNTINPIEPTVYIFSNETYSTATLFVPAEAVEIFKNTFPWYNFYSIKEYDSVDVKELPDGTYGTGPLKIYDLKGRYAGDTPDGLAPGLYIVRQGSRSRKIAIK